MRIVEDLHVREMTPLISPRALKEQFPITETVSQMVAEAREAISAILQGRDPRMLVVIGPCSIHDRQAAMEYAMRLHQLHVQYQDKLFIVMRTYLEKPRTTIGWRGLINDPHLDGSFDMSAGLTAARELLLAVSALGLPTAVEMLDPISPQYIDDLVCFAAIGARTVESQTHRALASGLSMPVGYKNSTDGNILVAAQAFLSATHPHSFLGINHDGQGVVVRTRGNPDGMIILRGSRTRPNYDMESVLAAEREMRALGLHPAIMIDCSHANAQGDYARQEEIWFTVLHRHMRTRDAVVGLMVESNLEEGKQPIPADLSQLKPGVSITDACVGWQTTARMLAEAYRLLQESR